MDKLKKVFAALIIVVRLPVFSVRSLATRFMA